MTAVVSTRRSAPLRMLSLLVNYRKILSAVTQVELAKKYSGSVFGKLWIVLYPLLLLLIYLFVYMVVFKMQFPGSSRMAYVLYVFAALIPYIGFSEAVTSGCVALRQNMHLIKNVMLPIEIVPARYVLVAVTSQVVGLALLFALIAGTGGLSFRLIAVPIVVGLQLAMLIGIVMILAPLALVLPDMAHFVNLAMLLLIFVSSIGFRPDMVPSVLSFVIYANPLYYMIDAFRWTFLKDHPFHAVSLSAYAVVSIGAFAMGSWFFMKFKNVLVDFE